MNKSVQLEVLTASGIVAVIRRPLREHVDGIAAALADGGVGALEITVDTPDVYEIIGQLKDKYGARLLVGAGTVLDLAAAEQSIDAGADFIFSPSLNTKVVELTVKRGRISIPGVMTPTEIVTAFEAGADVLKIFPGGTLGPGYLKELQGPLGHIPVMPTGGVNLGNAAAFIRNGAVALGLGGALINQKAVEERNYAALTATALQFGQEIKAAREELKRGE